MYSYYYSVNYYSAIYLQWFIYSCIISSTITENQRFVMNLNDTPISCINHKWTIICCRCWNFIVWEKGTTRDNLTLYILYFIIFFKPGMDKGGQSISNRMPNLGLGGVYFTFLTATVLQLPLNCEQPYAKSWFGRKVNFTPITPTVLQILENWSWTIKTKRWTIVDNAWAIERYSKNFNILILGITLHFSPELFCKILSKLRVDN